MSKNKDIKIISLDSQVIILLPFIVNPSKWPSWKDKAQIEIISEELIDWNSHGDFIDVSDAMGHPSMIVSFDIANTTDPFVIDDYTSSELVDIAKNVLSGPIGIA
tara:strand:- start:306 stop:620 length:315 start_codon:yes stop_codon:yes gene_type:complete